MSDSAIPNGYCRCGCGGTTGINHVSDPAHGRVRGQHNRFIKGHRETGSGHHLWKRGWKINAYGYVLLSDPRHPNADSDGRVFEHVKVIADALGHAVPKGAIAHHIDGDKTNNDPSNLVLCQNRAYHNMLHRRERALNAYGDANAIICRLCRCYHLPKQHVRTIVRRHGAASAKMRT